LGLAAAGCLEKRKALPEGEPLITITPVEASNPVRTQHVLVARVRRPDGRPANHVQVEWILNRFPGAVGDIVDADDYPRMDCKFDNTYAMTVTHPVSRRLDMGTADPSDDIQLLPGETWITITSTRPGDTDVTAFCRRIHNWRKHKAFAVKHWIELGAKWPPDAVNLAGSNHVMTTIVYRPGTGQGLAGQSVRWTIADNDPPALFVESNGPRATTKTGADGRATVTLKQVRPAAGDNQILIEVVGGAGKVLGRGMATKRWVLPQLTITKSGPATASVGQTIPFTMVVANTGNTNATEVAVVDTLPPQMEYLGAEPAGGLAGRNFTWSLGTLKPGESRQVVLSLRARTPGDAINRARVQCREGAAAQAEARTTIGAPSLEVTKTGPATVNLGTGVPYTIVVSSTGNTPASGVVLTDQIPAGMSYASSDPPGAIQGQAVRWDLGAMPPGARRAVTLVAKANQPGRQENVAVVTSTEGAEARATAVTVVQQIDLLLQKTGPAQLALGQNGTYQVTVRNPGQGVATGLVLTDQVPNEMGFISASDGGQLNGKTVTWQLGDLRAGEARTVSLVLVGTTRGRQINTATVTCRQGVTRQAQIVTDVVGHAAVEITKIDTVDPVQVGGETAYVISVRNEGQTAVTQLVIEDVLPEGMEFVSASGPMPFRRQGQRVRFDPVPTLAPNAQALVYQIRVRAVTPGDKVNTAVLTFKEFATKILSQEGTTVYR